MRRTWRLSASTSRPSTSSRNSRKIGRPASSRRSTPSSSRMLTSGGCRHTALFTAMGRAAPSLSRSRDRPASDEAEDALDHAFSLQASRECHGPAHGHHVRLVHHPDRLAIHLQCSDRLDLRTDPGQLALGGVLGRGLSPGGQGPGQVRYCLQHGISAGAPDARSPERDLSLCRVPGVRSGDL